ncbi:MAG: polyprenyl synthetase family protein [Deltaproteobacteria bacterium]|nr:polyprenyl synthetase family protein [Deltaproteobacteria bacterium]
MLDYPLREAKALRPALCIATCRALGGQLAAVLPSAAMLELFHNAFLIHDDVEDDSELRRGAPTLHRAEGVPTAVNVGDGMLALALRPLLDNTRTVGLGKALRILELVARMARESAEGQAIELDWIRANAWDQRDADYFRMVHKKTGWYSFITPVLLGALVGGVEPARLARLGRFATLLGLAFQVQDDALNLDADETAYGKELAGDLWEGKRTLILLHALGAASPGERARAIGILAKRRPGAGISELEAKSVADVEFLRSLVDRSGAIALARAPRGGARRAEPRGAGTRDERRRAVVAPRFPVRRGALRDRAGSLERSRALEARRGERAWTGKICWKPTHPTRWSSACDGASRSAGPRSARTRAPPRTTRPAPGRPPTLEPRLPARNPTRARSASAHAPTSPTSRSASASRLGSPATSSTRCARSAPRSSARPLRSGCSSCTRRRAP